MRKQFGMSLKSRVIASTLGCVAISFPLFLTACGDETTNVTETTGMTLVEKGAKMPDCTADNAGQMVYSTDSAAVFFCADGKWQSLKGEKGEQGIQGEQGPQGPKGEGTQGAAGKSCTAQKLTSGNGYKIVCGGDSVGVVMDGVGTNGTSCSATQETDGVRISCTDNTSFLLPNSNDGSDGKNFDDIYMVDHRDYHIYRTVTIGSQTWMAENLNYATAEGCYCYGETESEKAANCAIYGRLYTWNVAETICPAGWHLPDTTEWQKLATNVDESLSGVWVNEENFVGKILKSVNRWNDKGDGESGNGTDDFVFKALPGGAYDPSEGGFVSMGNYAEFWTSSERKDLDSKAWRIELGYSRDYAGLYGGATKSTAMSVRCVKDAE